jgi:transcriptional regulator GlxA family with amidase domain
MDITFVVTERMLAAGTVLPIEMWRAAHSTAMGRRLTRERLIVRTVSSDDRPVTTEAGMSIEPTHSRSDFEPTEVVYLPALWRNPQPVVSRCQTLLPWLRQQVEHGAMIAAVGTGCCFLAEAGLLDGKAATTHWHYFDEFARRYPRVLLKREYFITQAGSLFCAASVNALADVTVHLIEHFYGRVVASHVERNFSHEIRRPYEKYRYLEGDDLQHSDELIIEVELWMQRHLGDQVSMDEVARTFGISQRSLLRRFRRAIGRSPLEYLQSQRIRVAKELLESTNLTLGEVAFRVGYQDHGHFSRLFSRVMSVSPMEYRKTVRAKVFTLNAG